MAEPEYPWEGQCTDAAYDFALRCARLATQNPYHQDSATSLTYAIGSLITELWDRNFSQGEIKQAFETAVAAMPRYAAGENRPGELSTSDWRTRKGA
jgi:hypothetical protein